MQNIIPRIFFTAFLSINFLLINSLQAQDRCGTMELLDQRFSVQPSLRLLFEQRNQALSEQIRKGNNLKTNVVATIPVVFHLVLRAQSQVTEAQILAQLDTINKDYAARNAGIARIPSHFAGLLGASNIQFCLAQRTPDDRPTTGIVRYTTGRTSFDYTNNYVKHTETGGADAWDTDRYLNIWICDLAGGTLGYATFPNDGVPEEQGVAIDFSSLPGGSATGYNQGKTLTHELGHFFNLYHIWGDDNDSCSGTDGIADTPNQQGSTSTCRTGIVTDQCTPTAPGIMYQNYMDYTPDACLLMFTKQQVAMMDGIALTARASLLSSNGCSPIDLKRKDASIKTITQPEQRLCTNTFRPQVVLVNRGSETLTSVNINAVIDNGTVNTSTWTGSLATYEEITLNLPQLTTAEGDHILTIYTSNPNGAADENTENDTQTFNFIYYAPVQPPITESFEGEFPPRGWDIVNEDGASTWEKTNAGAKTGNSSVRISNFGNESVGQRDYLRMPTANIAGVDSAFISFQVAAATYTSVNTQGNVWDTLQVLISTDCGQSYTSIYKKWGSSLVTRSAATRTAFMPNQNEWRQEQIDISDYIAQGEVLIAFLNSNGNENDVYLDDINLRTVTVNPNLKEAGFLVTPNPSSGQISVQFYPHPGNLRSVSVINAKGQVMLETRIPGEVSTNIYNFDLTNYASGLYIIKAEFTDRVLTKKIIKR